MLHERLYKRLEEQRHKLRDGGYIEALGQDAKILLQTNAPSQTGTLVRNLGTSSGVHENQKGFTLGYGRRQNVGQSKIGAPRGTIRSFLRDYPEFRRNWSFVKAMGSPWKALPIEGRAKLQEERMNGSYGGSNQGAGVGMSAYLYPQEGTFDEWNRSAAKAGIEPLHFIDIALTEWRAYSIPRVMSRFARDMGLHA